MKKMQKFDQDKRALGMGWAVWPQQELGFGLRFGQVW